VIGIPAGGSLIAQSIAFGGLSSQQVGASFTISASASSGLPVSFTSLTPAVASVSGNVVTSLAVGTAVIAANQVGNAQYSTAPQVTQSFAVTQATAIQPPTGLTGYACDTGCWAAYQGLGIRINWTQSSSPNIVSNTIYRGNGQTGATSVVGTIPAGTFYLDKNVVKGQTYHYLVSATSSSGVTSALSNDTAVPF
jgi:fibronectin type 3 domain-containing protein